jgi:hypothetical protein
MECKKVYLKHNRLVPVCHVVFYVAHLMMNDIEVLCIHFST